jgi:hypothetical protein
VHTESDINEKCNGFLDIFLHTTVHLRESGKTGSLKELKHSSKNL